MLPVLFHLPLVGSWLLAASLVLSLCVENRPMFITMKLNAAATMTKAIRTIAGSGLSRNAW
ncbi:MAG: hypothetical protein QXS10_07195 [Candidatus Bathyarchaeia archaeon]